MKIAFVYSGQVRFLKDCFNNHLQFIAPNQQHEIDFFCHFWYNPELLNTPYWELYPERGSWTDPETIRNIFPTSPTMLVENQPDFLPFSTIVPDPRFPHPMKNVYAMYASIEKANKLKTLYEIKNNIRYDLVVKLRTDLIFLQPLGDLTQFLTPGIYFKNEQSHQPYAINDQFCLGDTHSMNTFATTYSHIENMLTLGCAANPECLGGFNVNYYNKIPVHKHNFYWKFWRDSQELH